MSSDCDLRAGVRRHRAHQGVACSRAGRTGRRAYMDLSMAESNRASGTSNPRASSDDVAALPRYYQPAGWSSDDKCTGGATTTGGVVDRDRRFFVVVGGGGGRISKETTQRRQDAARRDLTRQSKPFR